jgi:hypothetical protein
MPVRNQILSRNIELVGSHIDDRPHLGGLADLDV